MKKRTMRALGAGSAVAAMTLLWAAVGPITAQQRDDRIVIGPQARALSIFGGSGGYLGVNIADVDDERASDAGMSSPYGVYVSGVVDDGPAVEAGIEEGDVIVAWNGARLESVAQLRRLVGETPPGRLVELSVVRNGSEREISLELGDRGEARVFTVPGSERRELRRLPDREFLVGPRGGGPRSFFFSSRPRLGASIQSLGEQLADYFGVDGGALVTAVSGDSPAEAAGLQAGDVIIEVAGETVEEPGDLLEALGDREAGPVDLRIVRKGSERTITVELEKSERGGFRGRGGRFGEDGDVSFGPFGVEGLEVGPIDFEGFDMEPFGWHFDLGDDLGTQGLEISIPRLEIPAFEIPAVRFPGFRLDRSRVVVRV